MGKLIVYGLIGAIALFALEFFQVVDIPYLEIPDYMAGKKEMNQKAEEAMDQLR